MKNTKYAVFDIDGCCLNNEARLHLWPMNKAVFEESWQLDVPIEAGVAVYTSLMLAGFNGVFLTARPIHLELATKLQLRELFPGLDYTLLMAPRSQEDHATFKVKSLKDYLSRQNASLSDVLLCFDDNIDVVDAYRKEGLIAYQTAKGWK